MLVTSTTSTLLTQRLLGLRHERREGDPRIGGHVTTALLEGEGSVSAPLPGGSLPRPSGALKRPAAAPPEGRGANAKAAAHPPAVAASPAGASASARIPSPNDVLATAARQC